MSPKRNNFQSRRFNNKRKKYNLATLRQKDYTTFGESHPSDAVDTVKNYTKVDDRPENKDESNSSSSESEEEIPVLKQLLNVIGAKEEEPESEQEEEDDSSTSGSEEDYSDDENIDHSTDDVRKRKLKDVSEFMDSEDEEENELDMGNESGEDDVNDTVISGGKGRKKDFHKSLDTDYNIKNINKKKRKLNDVSEFMDIEAEEKNEVDIGSESGENDGEENGEESSSFIDDEAVEKDCFDDDSDVESEDDEFLKSDDQYDSESGEDNIPKTLLQLEEKTVAAAKDKNSSKRRSKRRTSSKSEQMEAGKTESSDVLKLKHCDPFSKHFEIDIEEDDSVGKSFKWEKQEITVPKVGKGSLMYKHPHHLSEVNVKCQLKQMHVKHKLCDQLASTNERFTGQSSKSKDGLSAFQHRLFCVLNSYQDFLYPKQDFNNMEDIRLVYCLHILNHVLKTRSRIVAHNSKLQSKNQNALDDIEYRDQGLTRPKILILLPYRDRALKVFKMLTSLLSASEGVKVSSRKRFETEFSELEKKDLAGKKYKSDDFIEMFEGNVDDNFRVGLSISKKSLRLYSPFYESDIILASPLGLRTVIGNEGDAERDFDFLSSIEILIMDQTDVFLMQNWDHVAHIFKHLHLQPKEAHGTDFSRVRMWAIDGLSKHFRQTVILSSVVTPEIMTVFNKQCHNYTGKLLIQRDVKLGTIGSCLSDAAQIFHRVICDKPDGISQRNAKLDFLKKKVIPHHTSRGMNQTVIFCNYFSFVLLRNYFREADVDFLFINEYDSEKDISKTRIKFRKKSPHFLLYTERLHFHHRFRLRGIHHIVWFDVPQYPQFYPEMVNLMEVTQQTCTSTCLYTKYDGQKVMEIVGQKRAAHIVNSEKSVHMITVS